MTAAPSEIAIQVPPTAKTVVSSDWPSARKRERPASTVAKRAHGLNKPIKPRLAMGPPQGRTTLLAITFG